MVRESDDACEGAAHNIQQLRQENTMLADMMSMMAPAAAAPAPKKRKATKRKAAKKATKKKAAKKK